MTVIQVPLQNLVNVSFTAPGGLGYSRRAPLGTSEGGLSALATDDADASYVEMWNNNPSNLLNQADADYLNLLNYSTDFGGPFQPGYTEPAGQDIWEAQLPATPLPSGATVTKMLWYASTRLVHGTYMFVELEYTDRFNPAITATPDLVCNTTTYAKRGNTAPNIYRDDVEQGKTVRLFGPRTSPPLCTARITRVWLEVTYNEPPVPAGVLTLSADAPSLRAMTGGPRGSARKFVGVR